MGYFKKECVDLIKISFNLFYQSDEIKSFLCFQPKSKKTQILKENLVKSKQCGFKKGSWREFVATFNAFMVKANVTNRRYKG